MLNLFWGNKEIASSLKFIEEIEDASETENVALISLREIIKVLDWAKVDDLHLEAVGNVVND